MNNLEYAQHKSAHVLAQDVISVIGVGPVTVSTVWLPSPWCHHETVVYWGDEQFHVIANNPGTVSAMVAHIEMSNYQTLCRFVHGVIDAGNR